MTVNLDFKVTGLSYDALDILCAQLTRDLFAIAKFLLVLLCIVLQTAQHQAFRDIVSQNKHLIKAAQCDSKYHK